MPEDLNPAEVVSILFPYMTAYQVLHRSAKVKRGESVLVHGAAGRVSVAALELGAVAAGQLYGTFRRAIVPRRAARCGCHRLSQRGFPAQVRELPEKGVDVLLDSLGDPISLRSFRALRPGGRLVVFGRYATPSHGHKNWPAVIQWYAAIATVWLWKGVAPPEGVRLPRPEVPRRSSATRSSGRRARRPGVVPGGLRRAGRATPREQDPPGRRGVPAAHRSSSCARTAGELGIEVEASPCAMSRR